MTLSPFYIGLNPLQSPTYANLCRYLINEHHCKLTRFTWRAHLSEKNFQFNPQAADCLEFKHRMTRLVDQYCPHIMPETYCIDDHNWPSVLSDIAAQHYRQNDQLLDYIESLIWILKPAKLNNGQHIKVFRRLSDIEQHFNGSARLGGAHVLQRYICQPHLLKGPAQGHKYSIRMFVIITNYAGAYLYPHGYFNIALQPYEPDQFVDLSSHLTNEHVRENAINVIQVPTQRYAIFKSFYPQIKTITTTILNGLKQQHANAFQMKKNRAIAIFGFDFMVDASERVWLLEANHGPCFPTHDDHQLQKSLYYEFWQALIKSFIKPIAYNQPPEKIQYQQFESVD